MRLPTDLPARVSVCRSLDRPNAKLIELLLTSEGARKLGASQVTMVAPYLCYMRQDKEFSRGEVVSQTIVGHFLARCFDTLITVDRHLHRVTRLTEAVPAKRAVAVSATQAMGEFLRYRPNRPLLVGPDRESEQWVRAVASAAPGWIMSWQPKSVTTNAMSRSCCLK